MEKNLGKYENAKGQCLSDEIRRRQIVRAEYVNEI